MSQTTDKLQELAANSQEMRALLEDFTRRQRVHKKVPLCFNRVYKRLRDYGYQIRRSGLHHAFISLEELGYGKAIVGARCGRVTFFQPLTPIRVIGLQALGHVIHTSALPLEATKAIEAEQVYEYAESKQQKVIVEESNKTVVLFKLEDQWCRAEIPKKVVSTFERLIEV